MRHTLRAAALAVCVFVQTFAASAHGPNDPPHQLFAVDDLKLESGETIKDFAISYVTHGKLNEAKSNVVLMVRPSPATTIASTS